MFGRRSEEGAVALTTALVLLILVLLAAFLVDLGGTRADARTDQLLADTALLAGASTDGSPEEQCRQAVKFLAANVGAGSVPDTCADLPPLPCDASTPETTTAPMTVGSYVIEVTFPVNDSNSAMTVQDQQPTSRDGDRCDRLKMEVRRLRDFTFGALAGGSPSGSSVNDAVARRRIEIGDSEHANLIVLDPTGCSALTVAGGSAALVEDVSPEQPGLIAVDSNGTGCTGNGSGDFVIVPGGTDTRICAGVDPADVMSVLPPTSQPCTDPPDGQPRIFTPAVDTDVTVSRPYGRGAYPNDVSDGEVRTAPASDLPVTRAPADLQWNCKDTYPQATGATPWLPTDLVTYSCDDSRDPYIEELASQLADSSDDSFLDLTWDTTYSDGAGNCTIDGGSTPVVGSLTRNIYFDCGTVTINGSVEIQAEDFIVIRGDLKIAGSLTVDTGVDMVMVLQDGQLATQGSPQQVVLERTAVYLHEPDPGGSGRAIDFNFSKTCIDPPSADPPCNVHPIEWSAPEGPAHDDPDASPPVVGLCEILPSTLPSPECFQKMALWSNADSDHRLVGAMGVKGVFFAPNSGRDNNTAFRLRGGAMQPMRQAQFFTYRLDIGGNSAVVMAPDPNNSLPTHELVATLIR